MDLDGELNVACVSGTIRDIIRLLRSGAKIKRVRKEFVSRVDPSGFLESFVCEETALHTACKFRRADVVEVLLKVCSRSVMILNSDGETAFHIACNKGNQRIAIHMLRRCVMSARDMPPAYVETALDRTMQSRNDSMVVALLPWVARKSSVRRFVAACRLGLTAAVHYILGLRPSQIELGKGLLAALDAENARIARIVLPYIHNVAAAIDANNRDALLLAARFGDEYLCRMLLAAGLRPDRRATDGSTALSAALSGPHCSCAQSILQSAPDIDRGALIAALNIACADDRCVVFVRDIIDRLDGTDVDAASIFSIAFAFDCVCVVSFLFRRFQCDISPKIAASAKIDGSVARWMVSMTPDAMGRPDLHYILYE